MRDPVWTEVMLSELRTRWDDGEKAKAIACALGVSKNAVVGKARRLNLTPRPNPIRRAAEPKAGSPSPADRAAALKAPTAVKQAVPTRARKVVTRAPGPSPQKVEAAEVALPEAVQPAPPPRETPSREGCRWPLWPFAAAPTHEYCGDARPNVAEPYCAMHRAIAGVPIKRLVAA